MKLRARDIESPERLGFLYRVAITRFDLALRISRTRANIELDHGLRNHWPSSANNRITEPVAQSNRLRLAAVGVRLRGTWPVSRRFTNRRSTSRCGPSAGVPRDPI